jgi:MoaA/NifB/PqqE/SkfB family radical SAM enzyme
MKTFAITSAVIKKFPKKSLQGKFCLSPFVSIAIDPHGTVSLCGCSGWMPSTVGNIFNQPIGEILSNAYSQDIRRSIADGTYEYCNENTCGIINSNQLNTIGTVPPAVLPILQDPSLYIIPNEIVVAGDATCNLSCPSCRTKIIKNTDEETNRNQLLGKRLMENLFSQPSDNNIRLHVSTSGELFASPLLMSFVSSIRTNNFPNLVLCIQSNGIMAPQNWHKLGEIQQRVAKITVTVDAARPDTYAKLRRGGTWDKITSALEWLSNKKKENGMEYVLRMVVQRDNYEEIVEFYEMAKRYKADGVEYTRLSDWHTYSKHEFQQHDVFDPSHAESAQAQLMLDQVKHLPDVYIHGGLS